ncbi:MAG: replication initiation protein [Eubacterium sp.]|nr:replication initiation protein [Eubacterium sp.]
MSEREKRGEIVAYKDNRYSKSNFLIGAKYKSSLLENKIMAISLEKIQKKEFFDEGEEGGLICEIKASELRKLLDANSGSFYKQLEPVAQAMTSRTIGMTDPDKREFEYISVINKAKYKDGIFTIKYNSDLKKYISNLQNNFTILELTTMLKFKSVYSFRLYELLRSKAYYPKGEEREDNTFLISFNLNELKLDMGVVNADLDSVRRVLNNQKAPDFDLAVERSPEKTFKTWYDFRRKVLDVATVEINEKTDMSVSYEAKKSGRGAKVYGVDFTVSLGNESKDDLKAEVVDVKKKKAKLTEAMKDEFIDNLSDYIEEALKVKDLRSIAEASEYDMGTIENAYTLLKKQNKEIDNVVAWLIAAIQGGWSNDEPVKRAAGKSNSFSNFESRDFDSDELEVMHYFLDGRSVVDNKITRGVMKKLEKQGMKFVFDDGYIIPDL